MGVSGRNVFEIGKDWRTIQDIKYLYNKYNIKDTLSECQAGALRESEALT